MAMALKYNVKVLSLPHITSNPMKVLMINGSPRRLGNTHLALTEIQNTLATEGIDSEIVWIGNRAMQGCIACTKCRELGHCVFQDQIYTEIREKLKTADGLIIGSPVYYAGPNGSLCALLDRLFYSTPAEYTRYKPAAAVVALRRAGATAALDRLNKYFSICNMPVVSSQYWNMAHGRAEGEAVQDAEGMQTMRTLGRNMAWLLKNIHGSETPQPENPRIFTNFIH